MYSKYVQDHTKEADQNPLRVSGPTLENEDSRTPERQVLMDVQEK
ncbi:7022_t:CDS:1, partial [Gigaspora rosea]